MSNLLFEPLQLGAIRIPNRIIMAPLTRGRADDRVPNQMMVEYYAARASTGLIISEATAISEEGYGWAGSPAIYAEYHVSAWKRVVDAVHEADGRIFLQLWHTGRVSHPDFLDQQQPVGPSAVRASGEAFTPSGKKPYVTPRPLETAEVGRVVGDYATAAERAKTAGFDGVEIHAANGYLIDQFLRDGSNRRNDQYGGSIENRCRFALEVVEAICDVFEAGRVGIRLSPTGAFNDMHDSDPVALSIYLAESLNRYGIAYVHTVEPIEEDHAFANAGAPRVTPHLRKGFKGALITNGGYTAETAEEAIREGRADAIAFGQPIIANPDFVARVQRGAELNEPDPSTFYTPGPKGYLDYPTLTEMEKR